MTEKPVLLTVGNIRIVRFDDMNVAIERLEEGIKPVTKEVVYNYRFKGYCDTVLKALEAILVNDWLVDESDISSAKGYVKRIEESNAELLEVMQELRGQL